MCQISKANQLCSADQNQQIDFAATAYQAPRIPSAMHNLLRGSTAKVNDDNDIDRTPEYKRFIEELVEFHRQRGYHSMLQRGRLLMFIGRRFSRSRWSDIGRLV